jgi:hypothetical protein
MLEGLLSTTCGFFLGYSQGDLMGEPKIAYSIDNNYLILLDTGVGLIDKSLKYNMV